MGLMKAILLLLFNYLASANAIQVVSTRPRPGVIVPEGSNVTISCTTSEPWFFCLFNSPTDDKQCGIQESEVSSVCSSDTMLSLSGSPSTCSLHIASVTREMHGGWMCLLNEINKFDSVKTLLNLEVGVAAQLAWRNIMDDGVLYLNEGEEKEILCEATDGYPYTEFEWESFSNGEDKNPSRNARMYVEKYEEATVEQSDYLIANKTGKTTYTTTPGSHLYSASQGLLYRANMSDNGTIIQCSGYQRTLDGTILYQSSVQLQLNVKELVVSQNTVIEERIGIISGIILAIIFIILIFILIAVLLTRRRKLSKKYTTLPSKSQEELLTPIWVPGKGSRVHVSSSRQFVHDYTENGEAQGLSATSEYSRNNASNIEVLTNDPRKYNAKLPEYLLNSSMETPSEDSSDDKSRSHFIAEVSLSRPTTRTTKTISDDSESSTSSVEDKSAMREYQKESYINFDSTASDLMSGAIDHDYSFDDTVPSDSKVSDVANMSCSYEDPDTISRLHETHFGDSLSDLPRTVIHSPLEKFPVPLDNLPPTGNTIFDCELGCFVSVEEFERRQRERDMN